MPSSTSAAKIDPANPRVWYNLGLLERAQSNCDASIAAFQQVVKLDPASADAITSSAPATSKAQDFAKAADEYREAIRLNNMHPSAEFGLARALQRSGNPTEARVHLARFEHITHEKLGPVMAPTYGDQGAYSLAQEIKSASPPVGPMIPITFANFALAVRLPLPILEPCRARRRHVPHRSRRHGKPDLIALTASGGEGGNAISYYHHTHDGSFELGSAEKLGLTATGRAIACAVGDFDNDTHPDLAVAMTDRVILYRNNGDGTFTDVTEKSGITQLNNPAGLTFIDFDHDGDVDLFVTGSPREAASSATSNVLWRNNGNQTFTEWTAPPRSAAGPHRLGDALRPQQRPRRRHRRRRRRGRHPLLQSARRQLRRPAALPKGDLPPAVGLAVSTSTKTAGWTSPSPTPERPASPSGRTSTASTSNASRCPSPTQSAPGESPPSTSTTTAGSISPPSSKHLARDSSPRPQK
jgi:hypothetical protein